ncbi:MAG: OadG-related small transporter subunit [Oscillospiraceae bacterium]
MEQVFTSLSVMLMGMCGIFIVMGLISVSISVLNKLFK